MDFDLILEKSLAIKAFDYPEEDGLLKRGSKATERVLNFGTSTHPGTGNRLTYGLDLDTLTAEDASILLDPEYLAHAWAVSDPIQRRDRLINIINRNEGPLTPKGGVEEGHDSTGYRLVFKRGPSEHHDKRKIMTPEGEKTVDEPHESASSSWKSYKADKIKSREMIMLDLEPFQQVLNQLDDAGKDYTFKDLSDDYLRKTGETGEAKPIEPEDIVYDEPEEFVKPEIVDDEPITPSEIDAADAKEIEEPEVKSEFEPEAPEPTPEAELPKKPEVKPEIIPPKLKPTRPEPRLELPKPEVEIEPEPEKIEEPEISKLEPDIEKAIDRNLGQPKAKPEESDFDQNLDKSGAKKSIDDMPGTEKAARTKLDIGESILRSLASSGLM